MRNLCFLAAVASGEWEYAEDGQFDIRQIRFFTRKAILELFAQTGYNVRALSAVHDERIPPLEVPAGKRINIDTAQLQLKNMAENDLKELEALRFIVDAVPLS